ncbi:sodium:glutamate symporter [Fusobacterium necrophorum subsp. funduliforme]|uniref:Sodium/glutamate symporter n=2 Tax=Fusobacterium necrophorum TaxID=859 RepID=A0AAN3VX10_9FUSO|nr:sodium/glutamate symporter [Fusobacterium necrophorum]AYV95024.1 sodium/glutamate symporter [Fusobacterium necrophorum subsp. funduliforme]EFS23539.2 sodium/glutamate symporter [Fusobacterium necrophorum D12]EJU18571.1 sodium/glutamate symporter [Fusobacterium necrophorum subsp. funduliforme Fnf 1007]KYL01359.1 sodium:glutamate symporter [Fusobacterium necrophorum subsp. funduliforme]KYL03744.1 sodium:glutamate symporter [Fusobacterium necrophorum subsp. funduliforme]
MNFEVMDGLLNINLNSTMTLALAAILLILGYSIKKKITLLNKYCIPAPVVGGFLFMFITWIGHNSEIFKFHFENIFQSTFMLAFFTTVGLGASFALLKKGGKLLIVYWLLCGIISILQNTIGITISKTIGLEAPYALLSSAISMVGGHGAALAYGNSFAKIGYESAPLVGAAAATFGLITAVLIGGPLGRRLIEANHLKPDTTENFDLSIHEINNDKKETLSDLDIIKNVAVILICMALGSWISALIGKLINMDFPSYVGAMFVAVIVRNLNEKMNMYHFNFSLVDGIGNVMLSLYLSLALMTLKLWELSGLIGGVLLVVACQVIFMVIVAYFIVFRILGSNYDAAVMCAGLCGHGLGATPSAIVNMTALNEKYGMSRKAMMIVPIVGAFLVDIIYQPATIWFIKTFVSGFVEK